ALPAATSDFVSILKGPLGAKQLGFGGSLQVVSGDTGLVLALFAPDGSVLYQQAGAGVGNVDPRQLLDTHQAGGDPSAPTTYERTVGPTAYLVQVQSKPVMVMPAAQPPDRSGLSATGPG